MPEADKPLVHMYDPDTILLCGKPTDADAFQMTSDWSLVTCPACLKLKPKGNDDEPTREV